MFREAGFPSPEQVIETVSPMVVTRLLEETNHLAVLAKDVAEYYATCGLIALLPFALSCDMDSFGIVTRKDWQLSPAATMVCEALEEAAAGTDQPVRPRLRAIPSLA
jgi:DNA-binding transcriptional LysR family regulator